MQDTTIRTAQHQDAPLICIYYSIRFTLTHTETGPNSNRPVHTATGQVSPTEGIVLTAYQYPQGLHFQAFAS